MAVNDDVPILRPMATILHVRQRTADLYRVNLLGGLGTDEGMRWSENNWYGENWLARVFGPFSCGRLDLVEGVCRGQHEGVMSQSTSQLLWTLAFVTLAFVPSSSVFLELQKGTRVPKKLDYHKAK